MRNCRRGSWTSPASVMIEKFAKSSCQVASVLLDLNHTSKSMILVFLMFRRSHGN